MFNRCRVAVGISGGVDSAVAAFILKQKGFDVKGVFMKNWDVVDEVGYCSSERDYDDALDVCNKLQIPLHRVDFIKQYWNEVFSELLREYSVGLTPNPDILCNRFIKFDSFFKYCRSQLGVDAIATGHYADTTFGPFLENYNENEGVRLLRPTDQHKDQTFFLSQVQQFALRRCMFPLARLRKGEVRAVARREGLRSVADKRDSTGICFIGKRRFQDFIEEYIDAKPGDFVDVDTGRVVGKHRGLHQWTVGQRCSLTGFSCAYFVHKKDLDTNNIYVVSGTAHPALQDKYCFTDHPHWIHSEPPELSANGLLRCCFRFQHTKSLVPCRIMKCSQGLVIILDRTLRALTPGQYGVLYRDNECLGSAKIRFLGPNMALLNKSDVCLLNLFDFMIEVDFEVVVWLSDVWVRHVKNNTSGPTTFLPVHVLRSG